MIYSQTQIDRFWNNVEVGATEVCWPWKRSTTIRGYGQVGMRINGKDRVFKAHKVAWELHNNQEISPNARALHTCFSPLCCNPHHVFVDVKAAKPGPAYGIRGERHGMSKLTQKQVQLIKYRLNALTTREIAESFGVSKNTIWDIRAGKTWGHV